MKHPLEFVPAASRKRIFLSLLFLTLILFGVFRVLDTPLRTPAAPNGILSLELASEVERANQMLASWSREANLGAAFGLGLDYLFMPVYAFALAFGTLLAADRHEGWLKSLGAVAGYGAFAAAVFDAVENYALFQILLNRLQSPYPEIALYCALAKFGLLIAGLVYALGGWLWPKAMKTRTPVHK